MIFAMARGSDGFGGERYLAYLPFDVALGATIEAPSTLKYGGIEIRLVRLARLYALFAGPFKTDTEADAYLATLRACVAWVALEFQIGTKAAARRGNVTLSDAPRPIADNPNFGFLNGVGWECTDGHYDAESANVIPDHKRLIRFEVGGASVSLGVSADGWSKAFAAIANSGGIATITADEHLMLSIELFAESKALIIPRTRFITLVIAIEALLPDTEVAEEAKAVLDVLKIETRAARDKIPKTSNAWVEIENLLSRVSMLKRNSIGSTMRAFVKAVAEKHPELGDPEELGKKVAAVYGVRSDLVHNGTADDKDLSEGLTFLTRFVPQLLKLLFVEKAS